MPTGTNHDSITDLTERLKHHTARARVAHARLIADQQKAWGRYAGGVADVLEQLERDLAEGKATLEEQRAARAAERRATIKPAVDRARASLEELRVQGDLLAMETRDRLEPARATAINALADVRGAIERLSGALRHDERAGRPG